MPEDECAVVLLYIIGTATAPEAFSRSRIKQVRTLRDQLMTASGCESMNARMLFLQDQQQDGGDPFFFHTLRAKRPNSPEAFKLDLQHTAELVQSTILKNTTDQTWPSFKTPGFEEVMGVDSIYMSDTKRTFSPQKPYRSKSTGELMEVTVKNTDRKSREVSAHK